MAKGKPKILDSAIAKATGVTVATRFHHDADHVWFLDGEGRVRHFTGGALVEDAASITARRESIHYSHALHAISDLRAFLGDARETSERAMAWSGRGAAYREAIRYQHRVLVVWGGNNARTLQSVGVTFADEAAATAFVASFRTNQPAGFVATSSHYVPGWGGVSREYWPPAKQTAITKLVARVLDETLTWTTVREAYKTEETDHADHAAAARAFDARELALFKQGGRPFEVEWMARLQPKATLTIAQRLGREAARDGGDVRALAKALLAASGAAVPKLPPKAKPAELATLVAQAFPAAYWLREGERAATLVEREVPHKKPAIRRVVYRDPVNHVVAQVDHYANGAFAPRAWRAKSAADALARWKKVTA